MKATQKDFASVAPRAAEQARIFLFCGPDEAGAHDAAQRLTALLADPGERIELSGAEIKRDPVRLGDEARSMSLFGGARHILVRAQGDEVCDAVENLLADGVAPCPVLIVASNATDKSRTAKLLSPRGDALVAMFYPPDLRSASDAVRQMGDAAGLRIDGDLAQRIARATGLDSRLAQSEVTKLALFIDASPERPRRADAQALDAIGARTEEDGFGPLVNVVLGGESVRLPGELRRMRELGLSPVGLLLAFERRVVQLVTLAGKLEAGKLASGNIGSLLAAEKAARRIFWKEEADLATQLRLWRGRQLERLAERLMALHRAMLGNNQSAELFLAQGLADITRAAERRGSAGRQ